MISSVNFKLNLVFPLGTLADYFGTFSRNSPRQVQTDSHLPKETSPEIRWNGQLERHHRLHLLHEYCHCTYLKLNQNILLFAFSSQQIVSIFPQIFESGKDLVLGNTDFTTLLGGAATGVLSAVIDIGGNTV